MGSGMYGTQEKQLSQTEDCTHQFWTQALGESRTDLSVCTAQNVVSLLRVNILFPASFIIADVRMSRGCQDSWLLACSSNFLLAGAEALSSLQILSLSASIPTAAAYLQVV